MKLEKFTRPLTFTCTMSKDTTGIQAINSFQRQFGPGLISCVYACTKRSFWITVKNIQIATRIRTAGVLTTPDEKVRLDPVDEPSVTLTIRDCPLQIPPRSLRNVLGQYGKILEHRYLYRDVDSTIPTRVRYVVIRPFPDSNPVPSVLQITGFAVLVEYPEVEMCLECGADGHSAEVCLVPETMANIEEEAAEESLSFLRSHSLIL